MCEPVTITAIVTSTAVAVETAAAAAAAAATAAAASVGSAVTTAATTVGSFLGIGGTAAGTAGTGISQVGIGTVLSLAPEAATVVGEGTVLALAAEAVPTGLGIADAIAGVTLAAGVGQGIASGVQAEQQRKTAKKENKRDAASKTVAALNARQQNAEASAKQQFQASRAAQAAAGVVKASNLGERSVAALSRAVGFELGTDKATIKRNQDIANLETSARLFGISSAAEARRGLIGETGGLTLALNTGASTIKAGANSLLIRNALSN